MEDVPSVAPSTGADSGASQPSGNAELPFVGAATVAASIGSGSSPSGDGGTAPRGRGRPPIHGLYSKAAGSDGKNPVRQPVGGNPVEPPRAPRPSLPPGLVAKIAKAGAGLADQYGRNKIKAAAIKAGVSESVAAPVIESAALSPEMKELLGELAPHALAEHGLDPSISPTGCMVTIMGMWFLGVQSAAATFQDPKASTDAN